jgi:hypothetical protein
MSPTEKNMIILGVLFVLAGIGLLFAGKFVSSSFWGWTGKVRAYVGGVCTLIVGILFLTIWR